MRSPLNLIPPRRRALLALVAGTIALAAPNAAYAAWTPAETVATGSPQWPAAVIDERGTASLLWRDGEEGLRLSQHAAGGSWEAPLTLPTTGRIFGYDIGADADGTVSALWLESISGADDDSMMDGMPAPEVARYLKAATLREDGTWSTPVQLSDGADRPDSPALTVSEDGEALAVWIAGGKVQSSTRSRTGSWSPAETHATDGLYQVSGALGDDGEAVVLWRGSDNVIRASARPEAGSWSSPVALSGTYAAMPRVAVDASGTAVAIWLENNRVRGASRPAGGAWQAATDISVGTQTVYTPELGVADDGRAVVVWPQFTGSGYAKRAATRSVDGTWSAPQDLGTGSSDPMAVAVNRQGDRLAAWRGSGSIEASLRASGAPAWATSSGLSSNFAQGPAVALDEQGNALTAWTEGADLKATSDDVAGPLLLDLSVPGDATAGAAATFTVNPRDVWSSVDTTTWDFGDGATASGPRTSHTYAAAGTYEVSVRSTDTLGHATTRTVSVTVGAAAAGGASGGDSAPDGEPEQPGAAPEDPASPAGSPAGSPAAPPAAPRALEVLVGGRTASGTGAAAAIKVADKGFDVGCAVTGTVLRSCGVDLYARSRGKAARSAALVRVGGGRYDNTGGARKLEVRVQLNATGRRLLQRSPSGLEVTVEVIGTPEMGAKLRATGTARLVQKRLAATIGGFEVNSDELTPAARRELLRLAEQGDGARVVRCSGHTDGSSGDGAYLRDLGLRRAQAVCDYLRSRGVRATWKVSSRGANAPAATNRTAAGRAENRRVELQIVR